MREWRDGESSPGGVPGRSGKRLQRFYIPEDQWKFPEWRTGLLYRAVVHSGASIPGRWPAPRRAGRGTKFVPRAEISGSGRDDQQIVRIAEDESIGRTGTIRIPRQSLQY